MPRNTYFAFLAGPGDPMPPQSAETQPVGWVQTPSAGTVGGTGNSLMLTRGCVVPDASAAVDAWALGRAAASARTAAALPLTRTERTLRTLMISAASSLVVAWSLETID
ncbi:hypothetical protein CGL27_10765 [Streptomyces sp. 11-1-2]|nr:hypothetical protein CGL27_10765 [Streptomyces sp. 11-1-2]